jgi:nonsense-mediated mRNA decay protein 3
MPLKQARSLSNISPLTVCTRIGNSIHLIDPMTLQSCDITGPVFWRAPFDTLATVSDLVEFTVLDIEADRSTRHGHGQNGNSTNPNVKSKYVLADAQVALAGAFRSSSSNKRGYNHDTMDMDSDAPQIFHTRTHLGAILQPGDTALGYHLTSANYNSTSFASLPTSRVPDIILVKKAYPNRRKKNKTHGNARPWKLRSIAKEEGEEGETGGGRGVVGRLGGRDRKKVEEDYEMFLRDLEEDPEMRSAVNLYKAPEVKMASVSGGKGKRKGQGQYAMDVDADVQEEIVRTTIEGVGEDNVEEDEEPDFPEVKLDELLEEFDEMTIGNGNETVE